MTMSIPTIRRSRVTSRSQSATPDDFPVSHDTVRDAALARSGARSVAAQGYLLNEDGLVPSVIAGDDSGPVDLEDRFIYSIGAADEVEQYIGSVVTRARGVYLNPPLVASIGAPIATILNTTIAQVPLLVNIPIAGIRGRIYAPPLANVGTGPVTFSVIGDAFDASNGGAAPVPLATPKFRLSFGERKFIDFAWVFAQPNPNDANRFVAVAGTAYPVVVPIGGTALTVTIDASPGVSVMYETLDTAGRWTKLFRNIRASARQG